MSWTHYYTRNQDRPCSPLLLQALEFAQKNTRAQQAIDLGCGGGIEAQELLLKEWRVHAIDSGEDAMAWVQQRAKHIRKPHMLTTEQIAFEDIDSLPPADLIFAGLSLPFCHASNFAKLWQLIRQSMRVQAVLGANFFGANDAWTDNPQMTFFTRQECLDLFDGLDVQVFHEVAEIGSSMRGPKHWRRFDVVAVKRGA